MRQLLIKHFYHMLQTNTKTQNTVPIICGPDKPLQTNRLFETHEADDLLTTTDTGRSEEILKCLGANVMKQEHVRAMLERQQS
jgi:hypothetical protein